MEIAPPKVRQYRLRGQRLQPRQSGSPTSVQQVVADVCGIQAQEVKAGMLSIGVRCEGVTAGDVNDALIETRRIVRIWTMRGTLHFISTDDLEWMLPLFGPVFIRASQKRRLDLGLDEETGKQGVRLLPRFDTYLLGYADRSLIIDPEHVKRIYAGGGMIHPALLVDGKVAGAWGVKRRREQVEVELELFEPLPDSVQHDLEIEIKAVSRFLSQG